MIFRFEDCVLDTERRELRCTGILRRIEPQVFDLLAYLIGNCDRVVSRDELLQEVWRGRFVSDSVLSTRVSAARAAIGDNGHEQRMIRTLRRKGFRFVAQVRDDSSDADHALPSVPPRRRLAGLLDGTPTVAVIPLANLGGNDGIAHFAQGLTEELITSLARLGWFSVTVHGRSFDRRRGAAPRRLARGKAGADYVLEGSVRESARRARVTVRLSQGAGGHCLWSERYERELPEVFAIQDEITNCVVRTLADQLYAAETVRAKLRAPDSLSTWQLIIRALSLMNMRKRLQIAAAERLLRKAIARDPACAAAYSLLSFTATLRVHLAWQLRRTALPAAVRTARKALMLSPDEPWAYAALGYAMTHTRPEEAIDILNQGLALDPNLAIAHNLLALSAVYLGQSDDAFRHADLGERLASYGLLVRGNPGTHDTARAGACFVDGRYRDGIGFARTAIARSPREVPAHRQLIANCALSGEIEQARSALATVIRLAPNTRQWIEESATVWRRREDFEKYAEAFRLAGLRFRPRKVQA